MTKSSISLFNLPNLLTIANMLCGIISILLSLHGRVDLAPYPLLLAALFDFADGFVARLLRQQGELGKQLDSLADMVSFGLAPAIMMMVLLTYSVHHFYKPDLWSVVPEQFQLKLMFFAWFEKVIHWGSFSWIPFSGLLIAVFSMLRLAKFNIDERQSDQFIGLPTPANTLFFCAFPLIIYANHASGGLAGTLVTWMLNPYVLMLLILLMSFLLIAEWPLMALKFKNFGWKGNELRWGFLITCLFLIVLLRFWSVPIIIILYLTLSGVSNLTKKRNDEV